MQNSDTCMFCRYRKARIAACCAAHGAAPVQQEVTGPAQAAPAPPTPDGTDRTVAPPSRQESVLCF